MKRFALARSDWAAEVAELSKIESRLRDERLIMPRRATFYGSTEAGYADPAGNIVVFSEHTK